MFDIYANYPVVSLKVQFPYKSSIPTTPDSYTDFGSI